MTRNATARGGGTPGVSFRRLLVALALGLALPAMLMAGFFAWRTAAVEGERFETQLLATARALALAVDRELGQAQARVETMALSPRLREGRVTEFLDTFAPSLPAGMRVALYDADGTIRSIGGQGA